MAVAEAKSRGAMVLSTHAAQFETGLSFVGLSDLLADVTDEDLAVLPAVQRHALDAALLRAGAGDTTTDWRAVSAGLLGLLRHYSSMGPVVIGIDDVQWLDTSSANVVGTALRRLDAEPVLVAMTRRIPSPEGAFDHLELFRHELHVIDVEPLELEALEAIIRTRLERRLPPAIVHKIHESSGGNPFYALEIARSIGDVDHSRGDPLPVPKTLTGIVSDRLAGLSDEALQVMLVVASASQPSQELVERALGDPSRASAGIEDARRAEVVDVDGSTLRFMHPLFASAIYEGTTERDRKALHNRLSELVDDVEQRAAHLARARRAPNEEVAALLEEASAVAKKRGALDRAAELGWSAVDFTPPDSVVERAERVIRAAQHSLFSGDRARLPELLRATSAAVPPGPTRARLLLMNVEFAERLTDGMAQLTEALEQAGGDRRLQAEILLARGSAHYLHGDKAAATSDARRALEIARELDDRPLIAKALGELGAQMAISGDDGAAEILEEASGMQEAREVEPIYDSPLTFRAILAENEDDLDTARRIYEELLELAEAKGDIGFSYNGLCFHLMLTEARAGRFHRLDELVQRVEFVEPEGVEDQGSSIACLARALADVYLGRLDTARKSAEKGARIAERLGDTIFLIENRWVLGLVALTEGNHEEACRQMIGLPRLAAQLDAKDPNRLLFDGDLIEALIGAGRLDEAETHLDDLQSRAERRSRTRARAVAARCRGMLADKRGNHEAALAALERAIELHDEIPDQPFELARTLLVKGIVERRAKQRGAARRSLARAEETFTELGNAPWAEKAATESKRIGGRAPSSQELTPTEEQVADLVAEGLSNKEVAERLYLSVKTVEANLSRIYRKLDVRSRTQLAQRMRDTTGAQQN